MRLDEIKIALWLLICTVLAGVLVMLLVNKAGAELCLAHVDAVIAKKAGFRWQWRIVDGRKCWFYANTLLPKEDLIWSYRSEDFDSDVRVIERKFYFPEKPPSILHLED